MALIIFLSGIGMAVSKHYCASELRDMKFFQSADSCMVISEQPCSDVSQISKEPCCKNEQMYFVDLTDKVGHSVDFEFNWNFNFHYFSIFQKEVIYLSEIEVSPDEFVILDKPSRDYDIPIWYQSFLI